MSDHANTLPPRESMDYDVLIVGGGPAGLSAAIRLKQLAAQHNREISVCVIEKASEIGAHILSGAIFDPIALNELIPDWREKNAPINVPVTADEVLMLTATGGFKLPSWAVPAPMHNDGFFVVRLGHVVKWLGEQAESLGVDIFAGFAGAEVLYNEARDTVIGVATGDMGILKNGTQGPHYQRGMALMAKYTLFAEGCRGHLGKSIEQHLMLRSPQGEESADDRPQSYGLGIKELWEVPAAQHRAGLVVHSAGYPMDNETYGGGFVYHAENNLISIGFVTGLGYKNPHLSPYDEFQRFKLHPLIRQHIAGGKRLAYGARAIAAGGLNGLPKFIFKGGALIGDDAGFLNPARIKGSHAAIKTGALAAESAFEALKAGRAHDELTSYPEAFRQSWLYTELYKSRNFKPYFRYGLRIGSLLFGIDQKIFGGKLPWNLALEADHKKLQPIEAYPPIAYPKPDGVISFDKLSSVFLSNTNHEEDQPCHLHLKDETVPVNHNLAFFNAPEQRYCPAGVYEIVDDGHEKKLQINAQNCVHCKTCDIKDPTQNINWVAPQGGEGPIYQGM